MRARDQETRETFPVAAAAAVRCWRCVCLRKQNYIKIYILVVAGLLATSLVKETGATEAADKTTKPEDVVLLEIDVKEPSKRSPVSASAVYGGSPSQYIIRHGDDAQEVRKRKIMFRRDMSRRASNAISHVTEYMNQRYSIYGTARRRIRLIFFCCFLYTFI